MTRTEDDLRTLLHAPVDADAPARMLARVTHTEPAVTSTRTAAPKRTWRVGLATGLALVVVGGTVTAVLVTRPDDGAAPAPAGSAAVTSAPPTTTSSTPAASNPGPGPVPPDGTVVSFLAGSGYSMGNATLASGVETVEAVESGAATSVATVHAGPFAVTADPAKPPVALGQGVTATWATAVPSGGGEPSTGDTLVWKVEGLQLAVQRVPTSTDAVVEAVARAVLVGAPEPLPVPVRVSAWPAAGWSVGALFARFGPDSATGPATLEMRVDIAVAGQGGTAATIDSSAPSAGAGTGTPVVIGGRTWLWDASTSSFTWSASDQVVRVSSLSAGIGRTELQALVTALTPASSFTDVSTWSDPGAAFPTS